MSNIHDVDANVAPAAAVEKATQKTTLEEVRARFRRPPERTEPIEPGPEYGQYIISAKTGKPVMIRGQFMARLVALKARGADSPFSASWNACQDPSGAEHTGTAGNAHTYKMKRDMYERCLGHRALSGRGECPRCQTWNTDLYIVDSQTQYEWDGEGDDPNAPLELCDGCSMEYSEQMCDQWDEYWAGRL